MSSGLKSKAVLMLDLKSLCFLAFANTEAGWSTFSTSSFYRGVF
jgi:hypothetical protein